MNTIFKYGRSWWLERVCYYTPHAFNLPSHACLTMWRINCWNNCLFVGPWGLDELVIILHTDGNRNMQMALRANTCQWERCSTSDSAEASQVVRYPWFWNSAEFLDQNLVFLHIEWHLNQLAYSLPAPASALSWAFELTTPQTAGQGCLKWTSQARFWHVLSF